MKRLLIAILFLAVCVSIGIYSLKKTQELCNNMIDKTETAITLYEEIKKEANHKKRLDFFYASEKLSEEWAKHSSFFYFFYNSDDIKQIEIYIKKLPCYAKNGDLEASYLCLIECLEEFRFLKSSALINTENIF